MSDKEYAIYQNIREFTKYRKFRPKSSEMKLEEFRSNMQFDKYIMESYVNNLGKNTNIYFMSVNSEFTKKSAGVKKLLSRVRTPTDIIFITDSPFKSQFRKVFNTFNHLRIKKYRHESFHVISPKASLCYKHEILMPNEIQNVLNKDLMVTHTDLPKIHVGDTQCIWIGAEVGDIIKITFYSEIQGLTVQYRLVISEDFKIVSFRDIANKPQVDDDDSDAEDADHHTHDDEDDIDTDVIDEDN